MTIGLPVAVVRASITHKCSERCKDCEQDVSYMGLKEELTRGLRHASVRSLQVRTNCAHVEVQLDDSITGGCMLTADVRPVMPISPSVSPGKRLFSARYAAVTHMGGNPLAMPGSAVRCARLSRMIAS